MSLRPLLLAILTISLTSATAIARESSEASRRFVTAEIPRPGESPESVTRADTLFLFAASGPGAWGAPGTDARGYTFDDGAGGPATAGWTLWDNTAQHDLFWHLQALTLSNGHGTDFSSADDFADGGPTAGNDFAWWCGVEGACGWVGEAGYGTHWDQYLVLDVPPGATGGTIAFDYVGDFEGQSFDYFTLYAAAGGVLDVLTDNHVQGEQAVLHVGPLAFGDVDSLVFAFHSDGGWSDQDGSYLSDIGAVWIDNLVVDYDGATDIAWDFESGIEADYPALHAAIPAGAGAYGALYRGLFAEDPCIVNASYAWAFFDPGTLNAEYPIPVTPYGPPYFDNGIRSPLLDEAHALGEATGTPLLDATDGNSRYLLRFMAYCDLPLNALVFYTVDVGTQTLQSDCNGVVVVENALYYGTQKRWRDMFVDCSLTVELASWGGDVTGVDYTLRVMDQCDVWCNVYGDGIEHTPAPYFDNVQAMLVNDVSPVVWDVDPYHRFQDNFPEAGTGKVRIDSALDIQPSTSTTLVIGDSTTIALNMEGAGGVATDLTSVPGEIRPQLYLHSRVIAGPHAGSTDPAMGDPDAGDGIWSPWIGTAAVNGETWNVAVADTAREQGAPDPGAWAFDFADDYFEPGDVIQFYYKATAVEGVTETQPLWAESADPLLRRRYTVRCLPTAGADLLFVEDGGPRTTDPDQRLLTYWLEAFRYNGAYAVDVYTTQAPSSGLNNGLGGRAEPGDLDQYRMILWDSADLPSYTLQNALPDDLAFDTLLLADWLNGSEHDTGLWVLGTQVASDLYDEPSFLNAALGAELVFPGAGYEDLTGIRTPRVLVTHPALEVAGQMPYFELAAGCPELEQLNLVRPLPGNPLAEGVFDWGVDPSGGAVAGVLNHDPDGDGTATSPAGYANRTLFCPFTYPELRNVGFGDDLGIDYARYLVGSVLAGLFGTWPEDIPDAADPVPAHTAFDGAYPNPFNPSTTLRFALATPEHARLDVYDLAGRRLRTLVDADLPAAEHEAVWDGRDDRGSVLPSGVYFARLTAGGFRSSQKLMLLK